MYYCYIVLCANDSFYVGVTVNPESRFNEHASFKGGRHTRLHKATQLLYTEAFPGKKEALKRERQLKGWSRQKKMNLIKYGHPNGKGFGNL